MKENNENEELNEQEEPVRTEKDEIREKIASPEFDALEANEKKELLHQYYEAYVKEKYPDEEKIKTKKDALEAHYDIAPYKAFENQLINCPSASFDDEFFKELDGFTDYIGSDSIQHKSIRFNPKMFSLFAKNVIKAAGEEPVDFVNVKEEEQIKEPENEAEDKLNTGMTAEPPKKRKPTEDYLKQSLALFNTKRASVFKQESELHKNVRTAASDLQKLLTSAKKDDPAGIVEKMKEPYTDETRMHYAVQWLDKTHKLLSETGKYLEENSGWRITPAGRDRKRGAQALKRLAKEELKRCSKAIEESGLKLSDVYKAIATEKVVQAENTVDTIKEKLLQNPGGEIPTEDRTKLFDAIHDALAGYASNSLIRGLEEKGNKNPGAKDMKNMDFYSARERIPLKVQTNLAIISYIENKSILNIAEDIKDPFKLVSALKKYHPDIQKDMMKLPKAENKPAKAPTK